MLGIPGVWVFSALALQIVNVMQFGNRSNIEDVKAGIRTAGWLDIFWTWMIHVVHKFQKRTRISIETVSFSQFQWVYNEKRNEQNVWQQSKRWKWCWKDLRKLQVSFQDTSMNVVTCIGVQHQAVAEAQKVPMGKWGLTIAFRDNVGKTTINMHLGMVNIPPICGDFGDGLWHCFTHTQCWSQASLPGEGVLQRSGHSREGLATATSRIFRRCFHR